MGDKMDKKKLNGGGRTSVLQDTQGCSDYKWLFEFQSCPKPKEIRPRDRGTS